MIWYDWHYMLWWTYVKKIRNKKSAVNAKVFENITDLMNKRATKQQPKV